MTMPEHMQLGAALDAGLLASLLRAIFGGGSVFLQTVMASHDGDATFCAAELGDIELIDLKAGGNVLMQKGAFLVSHDTVELHTTTQLRASKVKQSPHSRRSPPALARIAVHTLHMHCMHMHCVHSPILHVLTDEAGCLHL